MDVAISMEAANISYLVKLSGYHSKSYFDADTRALRKPAFIQPNLRCHYVFTSEAGGLHMNHALSACEPASLLYQAIVQEYIVEISKSRRVKDHLYLCVPFYIFVVHVCKIIISSKSTESVL